MEKVILFFHFVFEILSSLLKSRKLVREKFNLNKVNKKRYLENVQILYSNVSETLEGRFLTKGRKEGIARALRVVLGPKIRQCMGA